MQWRSTPKQKTRHKKRSRNSARIESNRIEFNGMIALHRFESSINSSVFVQPTSSQTAQYRPSVRLPLVRQLREVSRRQIEIGKRSGNKCLMEARSRNKPKPMNAWFACVFLLTNRATELQRRPMRVEANAKRMRDKSLMVKPKSQQASTDLKREHIRLNPKC